MKKTVSILLALILLMTLSVPGIAAAETDAEPAGGYKLTGVSSGEDSTLEILSKVTSLGINLYHFLQEDGTGCIRILEMEIPLSWNDGKIVIPPMGKSEDTITLPFTRADDGLKI